MVYLKTNVSLEETKLYCHTVHIKLYFVFSKPRGCADEEINHRALLSIRVHPAIHLISPIS